MLHGIIGPTKLVRPYCSTVFRMPIAISQNLVPWLNDGLGLVSTALATADARCTKDAI